MLFSKESSLLSSSFAASAFLGASLTAADAQDVNVLFNCLDLTTGALKADVEGCRCADLVAFCSGGGASQYSSIVPGLDDACAGASSCCEGESTDAVAYNACWEESGVGFPDLSALLSSGGGALPAEDGGLFATDVVEEMNPETSHEGHGPASCWDNIVYGESGASVPTDQGPPFVCFSYCTDCTMPGAAEFCTDEEIAAGEKISHHSMVFEESVEYYAWTLASSMFTMCHTDDCNKADACAGAGEPEDCSAIPNLFPMYYASLQPFFEQCCTPGDTTLGDAVDCIKSSSTLTPPASCDEDPDAPVCTCILSGNLNQTCDCGVMLDLYEADPSKGVLLGLIDQDDPPADLESCCTRGEMTVAETTECIANNLDCGVWLSNSNQAGSPEMVAELLAAGESCCTPGEMSIGEALPCIESAFLGGVQTGPNTQDVDAVLNCIDLGSGALNGDVEGCHCAMLVTFCSGGGASQYSSIVPGLDEACAGASSCCESESTDAAAYNVCWEESGVEFPNLSALLSGDVSLPADDGGLFTNDVIEEMNPEMSHGVTSIAQDMGAVVDCIDLATGALKDDVEGCTCAGLAAFCLGGGASQYSILVPGLEDACAGVTSCCEGESTDAAGYNACWEESGVGFPDLSALLPGSIASPSEEGETGESNDALDSEGLPSDPGADTSASTVSPTKAPTTSSVTKSAAPSSPAAGEEVLDDENGAATFGAVIAAIAVAGGVIFV